MSLNENISNEKVLYNSNIFLGKKIENNEKCKLCNKKENLMKCIKCSNYNCNDCLNSIFKTYFEEINSEKYLCQNCLKKNDVDININKCFICNKSIKESNSIGFNVNKEQKNKLKNELNKIPDKKELSLLEEEDEDNAKNEEKNKNQKSLIKICNECNTKYEELIEKCFLLRKDKEEIKNKKIMDELTNFIKKENGDKSINIFDILENKFEKVDEPSKDITKKRQKDLFESIVVNRIEKEKDIKIDINKENNDKKLKEENKNIINNKNNNQIGQNLSAVNINSNNKTSNIYLPNFFNITQLQTNQNSNSPISNQKITKNISNIPILLNNKNPQNDLNTNLNQNQGKTDILNKFSFLENKNNIYNLLNEINDTNNKLNNCSKNLKDVKENINNLTNINNPNNNMNINNDINPPIRDTLSKISNCLYIFDINNIENSLNIINKIESLTNLLSDLVKEQGNNSKEEINIENKKEEKLNTDNNYKEVINKINNSSESLKNQLKTLKAYIDMKKIYVSLIYQNIDIYLKEINKEKNNKNKNQIQQPNVNNMIPIFNPINTFNNLQGINLLNNIDINSLYNNLIFPVSPIFPNSNNINNTLPLFNSQLNIPNFLSQTRLNGLRNPLFQ